MRISDWSSDVCSSDLAVRPAEAGLRRRAGERSRQVRGGDGFLQITSASDGCRPVRSTGVSHDAALCRQRRGDGAVAKRSGDQVGCAQGWELGQPVLATGPLEAPLPDLAPTRGAALRAVLAPRLAEAASPAETPQQIGSTPGR